MLLTYQRQMTAWADTREHGRRPRAILRFGHTGEVLGLAGQTVAGLVSLGAVVLVWTRGRSPGAASADYVLRTARRGPVDPH